MPKKVYTLLFRRNPVAKIIRRLRQQVIPNKKKESIRGKKHK